MTPGPGRCCVRCGYDTSSLVAGQPCPECGDCRPGAITPWPTPARIVWQMARAPSAVVLLCAFGTVSAALEGNGVVCLLPVLMLGAGVFLIAWPF